MDAEKLNQALYDKMAAEQKEYRSWLLEQSPEEILNHAFEYSTREDILMEMSALLLSAQQAAVLLTSSSPLADVYKDFRDMETSHMDEVRACIEDRAESLLEALQDATYFTPIYQKSAEYAMEHGELDAFWVSRKANVDCKDAIEATLRAGYDGRHLTASPKAVMAEFGPERVAYVLAATIQRKDWDERFSRDNKAWAATIPIFDTEDQRGSYIVHIHSGIVNLFVNMVRKELDVVWAQTEQALKKPSIKAQLAAKPVTGDQPAKPKDREGR